MKALSKNHPKTCGYTWKLKLNTFYSTSLHASVTALVYLFGQALREIRLKNHLIAERLTIFF